MATQTFKVGDRVRIVSRQLAYLVAGPSEPGTIAVINATSAFVVFAEFRRALWFPLGEIEHCRGLFGEVDNRTATGDERREGSE